MFSINLLIIRCKSLLKLFGWLKKLLLNNLASKFETKFLMDAVKECVATDENVKSGRISDRLGVELLIVKYSM